MVLGTKGGVNLSLSSGSLVSSFLNKFVILIIKPKARTKSSTIAAICARISALELLRTLGLSMIFRSCLIAALALSEAERILLIRLYRFDPLGI